MQHHIRRYLLHNCVGASLEDIECEATYQRPLFFSSSASKKRLYQDFSPKDPNCRYSHRQFFDPTLSSYLSYAGQLLAHLAYTFFFQFGLIFIDPLNFFITFFSSVQILVVLFIVQIGFFIYRILDIASVFQKWGENHADGLSPVNWDDPALYRSEDTKNVVQAAKRYMEIELKGNINRLSVKEFGEEEATIAQLMILICGLMYERQEGEETLEKIKRLTEGLDLQVELASEIRDGLSGPYSALFWCEKYNFVVVAFKGTTPDNFKEWLVDASFMRTDGNSFLFGQVHEGFYKSLFSNIYGSVDEYSAYTEILSALGNKINHLRKDGGAPPRVWVTGHSLGGALATLFFSRLFLSPGDIQQDYVLRDCYTIGGAIVGDPTFASKFEGAMNSMNRDHDHRFDTDKERSKKNNAPPSRHWRIVLDGDIVPKLPQVLFPLSPGLQDFLCRHSIMNYVFNFVHVGDEVLLRSKESDAPPSIGIGQGVPAKLRLKKTLRRDYYDENDGDEKTGIDPTKLVVEFLPQCIQNHIPSRYYHKITAAKKFLAKADQTLDE
eukprot:TRINITY_DN17312_c0_g1_i1.p1 TRINITY_DN17312_c0_g1~~TRINITY_DN17312_c0_g1_i1.p1  ORF type:complete len:551 (+),score=105.39 TRINITY_DN17312_c0_g1_i1:30-1682(+)